jgi:hypothetical protein
MKCTQVKNKGNGLRLNYKLLSAGLALILAVALANVAKAAMEDDNGINALLLRDMKLFDPFTLKTVPIVAPSETIGQGRNIILTEKVYTSQGLNALLSDLATRPTIRIPFRPALRSPFRPPLF